jgi:KDO2-lipid IV(A) lauroyltransferase
LIQLASRLPFWALHRISDIGFILIYHGFRYRRRVVRENLAFACPDRSPGERLRIERLFYRNFTDTLIETVKGFSISREEIRSRIRLANPERVRELWDRQVNIAGISSHLANWEFLAQALAMEFGHHCYGVYKPLKSQKMNDAVVRSRERFGIKMIPMKTVRKVVQTPHDRPYLLGLLSDQAPHDYEKAFQVSFLGQPTYVVPGPGILTVQLGLTPIWGWMRRSGRSRFEWGIEELSMDLPKGGFSAEDQVQIERISRVHGVTSEQAARALALIQRFSEKLELQIKMAPQDWLWSHRRWKKRSS